MGNTKDTGFLRNLISYDASGNIVLPANLTVNGAVNGASAAFSSAGNLGTQLQLSGTTDSAGIRFTPVTGEVWEIQANTSNQWFVYNRTDNEYRFVITGGGNVGIGTTNPAVRLDVDGSIRASGAFTLGSGYAINFYDAGTTAYTWIEGSSYNQAYSFLAFTTGGSEKVRILSDGKTGIGTNSPLEKLHVAGSIYVTGGIFLPSTSVSNITTYNGSNGMTINGTTNTVALMSGGYETIILSNTGKVGIGTSSPTLALSVIGQVRAGYATGAGLTIGLAPNGVPNNDLNAYVVWGDNASFGGENGDLIYIPRTSTSGNHRFYTGSFGLASEKVRITYEGRVGIGTTAPAYNLSVASYLGVGAQGGGDIVLIGGGSGVGAFIQLRYATGTTNVHLAGNGNSYLNAYYGNTGVGTTNPASTLSVQGEIAKYCTTSGVDGNFQNLIKYGYSSDLQSGNSTANRWIGIDATVTAGAAVTNTLRIRAYGGGSGNAVPVNVADFRGDLSSVFYGYIKHNTRVFSGNSYVGNLSPNLNTAYTRNYLLVCDLNNVAGFSLSGHMNAASYTCWNMSSFWIMKNYSSTNGTAGITGMYKGGGCDMNIVDLNYAGGRYIAIGYTSNPEVNGMWIGYRVNHMLNADGSAIVVPDSSVSINSTYATY